MIRTPRSLPLCLLVLGFLLLRPAALAQGGLALFQFSFSNPGARSLGFGGAFVALADDATSAYANPAGLVQLGKPEVSLEGRSWSYSTPFTRSGRIDGQPTGWGIDTNPGLTDGESNEAVIGASFLSLVYPRSRWSLAFYRHELANFEFSSETQGLFSIPFPPDTGFRREGDRRIFTDLKIVGHGLAAGWRVTDDLSLGLGLVYFDVDITGTEEFYAFDSLQRFFEENSYLPERNFENRLFTIDDDDWGLAAGWLWRPSERWSLGGSYRQGPRVSSFVAEFFSGASDTSQPPGTLLATVSSPLAFPDVFALGTAFRSGDDRLTVSFEWDHVEYSDMPESLTFDAPVRIDDGDELHAGVEYVFLETRPLTALRIGAWFDPDHRVQFLGEDRVDRAVFRPGDNELHLALGLGLVFRTLQLDLGVDFSDPVQTVALSTIYSF